MNRYIQVILELVNFLYLVQVSNYIVLLFENSKVFWFKKTWLSMEIISTLLYGITLSLSKQFSEQFLLCLLLYLDKFNLTIISCRFSLWYSYFTYFNFDAGYFFVKSLKYFFSFSCHVFSKYSFIYLNKKCLKVCQLLLFSNVFITSGESLPRTWYWWH